MVPETLILKEIGLLPELFLGISIIYLLIHGTFLTVGKNYPIIQTSNIYLSVLIFCLIGFLLINDSLDVLEYSIYNNTISNDYLAFSSKILIIFFSIFCLLIIKHYLVDQRINNFEYILMLLFAILGIMILCSANDLITVYLAIELQSLAFYVMAAFKKNSTFSVEAGLKYFILGAFSSGFFLFGSSIIYGLTGSVCFEDFKDLFFWVFPGSFLLLSDIDHLNYDKETSIKFIQNKLNYCSERSLDKNDYYFLRNEFFFPFYVYLFNDPKVTSSLAMSVTKALEKVEDHSMNITAEEFDFFVEVLTTNNICVNHLSQLDNLLYDNYREEFDTFIQEESSLNDLLFLEAPTYISSLQDAQIIMSNLDKLIVYGSSYQDSFFGEPFNIRLLQFALIFIIISLFFKLALAPFHLWSPDVYEGSPSSSSFFFAVISKLGIFIILLRIFYSSFYGLIDNWRYYIVLIAVLSILVGSIGGIEQRKLKSLLAYSSISHMGYVLIAFNTGTFEGFQMLFSYLIIYMLSGLCIWSIFLLTRLKNIYKKKQNKDLTDLILLRKSNSILAFIFAIVLLSIAGFPPMIGFFVKMSVFLVAIEASLYFVAFVSILCSVISTFYYIRIVKILYFEKVIVGRLYYPITTSNAFIIIMPFYLLFYLFINPTILYLFSYKISLLFIL
jgi:NADH:ubiquinone oxidoreductase subunit 2 (subunit N)|nr:NADH dehydrogenase subunit 2 [Attheya longicornis]